MQICQTDTETEYIMETDEGENYYTFSCGIPEGSGDAAMKLIASAAAVLTAHTLM